MWALIDVLSTIEAGLARIGSSAWIEEERAFQVDRDRAVETGFVPLLDRPEFRYSGVDEQDVQAAEALADGLGDRLLTGDVSGVGADRQHVAAEFLAGGFEGGGVGAGDRDAGTFLQELAGRFKADAAGAAGDEGALVLEPVHDEVLSLEG